MNTPKRNDPCSCGSGKKYKKCCYKEDQETRDRKRGGLFGQGFANLTDSKHGKDLLKTAKLVAGKEGSSVKKEGKGLGSLFSKAQEQVQEDIQALNGPVETDEVEDTEEIGIEFKKIESETKE